MVMKMMVIIVVLSHMCRALAKQAAGCAARLVRYLLICFLGVLFL